MRYRPPDSYQEEIMESGLRTASDRAKVRLARSKCSTNLALATPMWTASSDFDLTKDSVHLHWKSQQRFSRYMANSLNTYCMEEEPVVLPIPESPDLPPIMSPSPVYSPPLLCPSPTSRTTPTAPAVTPLVKEPTTLLTSSHAVGSPSTPSEWHSPKHPARMKCPTDQMSSISKSGCQYGIVYQHLSESNDHEDTAVSLSPICQENHAEELIHVATQKTRKRSRNPSPLKEYSTSPTKRLQVPEDMIPCSPSSVEPSTSTTAPVPDTPHLSVPTSSTPTFRVADLSSLPSTRVTVNGESYNAYNVPGDGNCFFNSLSLALHGNIDQHKMYRNIITNHILHNWESFEDQIHLGHDQHMTKERYIHEMQEENGWSSTVESQVASTLLKIDIDIHFKHPKGIITTPLRSSQSETDEKMVLLLESNHYKVLRPFTQSPSLSVPATSQRVAPKAPCKLPQPNRVPQQFPNRVPYTFSSRPPHAFSNRAHTFNSRSVYTVPNRNPRPVQNRAFHPVQNRAQHSLQTTASYPTQNRPTHTSQSRSPNLVTNRAAYTVHNRSPHFIPNRAPQPVQNRAPQPVQNRAPQPVQNRAPQPVQNRAPQSVQNRSPQPVQNRAPHPVQNRAPQSVQNRSPQPVQNRAPRPVQNRAPRPVQNRAQRPVQNRAPQPVQNRAPHPVLNRAPHPVLNRVVHPTQITMHNTISRNSVSSTATAAMLVNQSTYSPHTDMSCTASLSQTDSEQSMPIVDQLDDEISLQNETPMKTTRKGNHIHASMDVDVHFGDHSYCRKKPALIGDQFAAYGARYEMSPVKESKRDRKNRKRRNARKAKKLNITITPNEDHNVNVINCNPLEKSTGDEYDNNDERLYNDDNCYADVVNNDIVMENEKDHANLDAIRKFELEEMKYSINNCTVCKETRINMILARNTSMCQRCHRDKKETKMYSTENNMIPSVIPPELDKLTMIEQQLISKISPCINIHMLKHGGIASSGHCVTFPQAINEVAQVFPRLPSEISIIKVRKTGLNDSSKDFRVRRYIVQSALVWLKSNNPVYNDITISEERLALLPEDGQLENVEVVTSDLIPHPGSEDLGPAQAQFDPVQDDIDGETHSAVLLPEPAVDIRQQVESIIEDIVGEGHAEVIKNRQGTLTIPWPTRADNPLSEFITKHFFTLAFPCLFPNGEGDFFDNRIRTCSSLSDWGDHLMWFYDGRFAHHSYFKFVLHNMINRKAAINASNYVIHQQLGEDHISVAELKEKLNNGDDTIIQKILYFSSNIRGSSQYWTQRGKELRSLIEFQLQQGRGLPSLFVTGSCAEFYFKPLRRLLTMYEKQISGIDIDLTDPTTLFNTLQQNTHIVGHYFDLRSKHYFDTVMKDAFGIDCYWFRHEFAKSRGMIHWHGLCWRGDTEPHKFMHDRVGDGFNDNDCARLLSEWAVDEFKMTASHPAGANENGAPRKDLWPPPEGTAPAPPDEMNPLVKLLMDQCNSQESFDQDYLLLTNRINIHRCSSYCLQQKSAKHPKECRMDYGVENGEGKPLRQEPALVTDRNGCLRLEMARDHPRITQHSRLHTQAWRANGDISIIVTKSGVENPDISDILATEKYVSGYACKGNMPTGSVNMLFKDMVNAVDSDEVASGKSTIMKLLISTVKRDISSVEASYELSSFPLYHCTHLFQSISLSGSRLLEKKGNKISKNSVVDRYTSRDVNDQSSLYQYICNGGKVPVITGGVQQASWPLTEYYARTTLLLHYPNWRKLSDIKEDNVTWLEALDLFLHEDRCPNFVKADIERARQGESRREEQNEEGMELDEDQPDWMEVIQPHMEYNVDSEVSFDDGGEDYDWTLTSRDYPSDLGEGFIDQLQQMGHSDEIDLPDVDITLLNEDQQFVFSLVMHHLTQYKEGRDDIHPLRLIVAGSAGSGKSYLIKCLVFAIKTYFQSNSSVQVLCPTGNSANIISGVTMHSFLKLPISTKSKELSPPDGLIGKSLQCNCDGVEVLLVDERSLIGATTLGWMEYMCRYGMYAGAHSDESWGGLPVVVFFGDDVQLPPVLDSPVYNSSSKTPAAMHGVLVWQEFDNAVILSKVLRQSDSNVTFKEVLNSLRNYTVTSEQSTWLQQFQWNNLLSSHGERLLSAMNREGLFVFPSSRQELVHNTDKLIELNSVHPVVKCVAINKGQHAASAKKERSCGLSKIIYLGKGAKVSLCVNLSVPFGLFNRATGCIVDILYSSGKRPSSSLPTVIMVDFPTYTGPPFIASHPTIVPIRPIQRSVDCTCHGCKRTQIPLRLAWATTIHSCQGQTIGRDQNNRFIIIHPGTNSFESHNPGALFVALSRAKCVDINDPEPDMAWHPSVLVNEDRLRHVPNNNTVRARTREIARIYTLYQKTSNEFSFLRTKDAFEMHSQIIFNCSQNEE